MIACVFVHVYADPKINELSVRQLGASAEFEVSTSLAYTGGGVIDIFTVSYRQSTFGEFRELGRVSATSSGDSLVWTGTFTISDPDFDPSTDAENIQFLVFVYNQFGFQSNGSVVLGAICTCVITKLHQVTLLARNLNKLHACLYSLHGKDAYILGPIHCNNIAKPEPSQHVSCYIYNVFLQLLPVKLLLPQIPEDQALQVFKYV